MQVAPDGQPRAGRGQRRRRRLPDAAGSGHGRTARARACTLCARWPTRWGIDMRRDQPGKTVWFSLPRCRTVDADGLAAAPYGRPVGRDGPAEPVRGTGCGTARRGCRAAPRGAGRTSPPGPSKGSGWCSTGCATRSWPPTTQGVIRYVNAAAEDLLGWPRGGLVGRPVFDLVPGFAGRRGRRRLRGIRALPGLGPRRASARRRHQAGRRHRRPHRVGHQHLRPPARRPGRRRHHPAPRRDEAPALVRADERAARDPRRRADRRAPGRAHPRRPWAGASIGT